MTDQPLKLGPYTLKHEIGSGGMAEVWMATREMMGATKTVAIKLLNSSTREDQKYREMFLKEARLSAQLTHSTIVQVSDVGEIGSECYIAMEWVDGLNLAQLQALLWERSEHLPLELGVYVCFEILTALDYAHNLQIGENVGIIHRDISPQNVMLSVNGEVKLMDFGVARMSTEETSGTDIKGKIRYMPPEQLGGSSKLPTVDLFPVGAILYEILEGRRFRDEWSDQTQLLVKSFEGVVPQLSQPQRVPPELLTVLQGLLEPNASLRIGSARAAMRMISEWPGYRDGKLAIEALVRRFRDHLPKANFTTSASATRGDVKSRIAARAAVAVVAEQARPPAPMPSSNAVNPATASTQLAPEAADDTHVGNQWPEPPPRLIRAGAVFVALLGFGVGLMTFVYTLGVVWMSATAALEGASASSSDAPHDPPSAPASDTPLAVAEPSAPTPAPTVPPEPAPAPTQDVVVPTPEPAPEQPDDSLVLDEQPPAPEPSNVAPVEPPTAATPAAPKAPPKPQVSVTFLAGKLYFAKIKVRGKTLVLDPKMTKKLPVGTHTVWLLDDSGKKTKAGKITLSPGQAYTVRLAPPASLTLTKSK